jgi:hypothetical protein
VARHIKAVAAAERRCTTTRPCLAGLQLLLLV